MAKRLTDKQEDFVQALISGSSQHEAYLIAYPSSRDWKPANVDTAACKLLRVPHVLARYEELKSEYIEEKKKKSFYDRDNLLDDFMYLKDKAEESIEQTGVRQANSNAYINALKNIGDILDLYPDKKQNIKLDGDIKASVNNPFEGLTEEELKKLIDSDDK